jgi:hypothetical protein
MYFLCYVKDTKRTSWLSIAWKAQNLVAPALVSMPERSSNPGEVLGTKKSYHTREYSFPKYDKIYQMLNILDFSSNDEDLEVYQNIWKNGTHLIVACHTLFSYNEVAQCCLK